MARTPIRTYEDVQKRCDEIGECLVWRGATTEHGCPKAEIGGKTVNVRNFVYCLDHEWRNGYHILPSCGTARCLAKGCLGAFTISKVRKQAAAKEAITPGGKLRRQRRMVAAGIARLNPELAAEIRRAEAPSAVLAETFGVHVRTIQRIRKRETWAPHSTPNSIFNLGGTT